MPPRNRTRRGPSRSSRGFRPQGYPPPIPGIRGTPSWSHLVIQIGNLLWTDATTKSNPERTESLQSRLPSARISTSDPWNTRNPFVVPFSDSDRKLAVDGCHHEIEPGEDRVAPVEASVRKDIHLRSLEYAEPLRGPI